MDLGDLTRYHLCINGESDAFCSICDDICELEAEIAAMEKSMLALKTKHYQMRSRFNAVHDPITRNLPVEMISHIFLVYAPPNRVPMSITLRLGSICRAWRDIAWSTPRLWTNIHIDVFRLKEPRLQPNSIEVVKGWLERSGNLPLSIFLHNSCRSTPDSPAPTESYDLIEVINRYSTRWHTLGLTLFPEFLFRLKGFPEERFLLHTFSLSNPRQSRINASDMIFRLPFAPSPVEVRLEFILLKNVEISWNCVSDITVTGLQLDECLEIIRRAPSLVSCRFFHIHQVGQDYRLPQSSMTHSSIRKLLIVGSPEDRVAQLFDRITFPALCDLAVLYAKGRLPAHSITAFFRRSSCQLKYLCFDVTDTRFEISDIIQLLKEISSLKQLRFLSSSPFEAELNCMDTLFSLISGSANIKPGESGSFLPNLQILAVLAPRAFSWGSILSLPGHCDDPCSERQDIYQRPLKTLTFTLRLEEGHTEYVDKDVIPGLLQLIKKGISLEIFERMRGGKLERGDLLKLSMVFHGLTADDYQQ